MARILDPAQLHRFAPAGQDDVEEGRRIVYLLKVPTLYEHVDLKRALAARGARQHSIAAVIAAAIEGLGVIYEGDADSPSYAAARALLQSYRDAMIEFYKRVRDNAFDLEAEEGRAAFAAALQANEAREAAIAPICDLIAEQYPRFAQMRADNAVFDDIFAIEAARKFLRGWENLDLPFERDATGVPESLLARLPNGHLAAIGVEVGRLLAPEASEAKNSGSPSRSSSAAATSTASSTPRPKRR